MNTTTKEKWTLPIMGIGILIAGTLGWIAQAQPTATSIENPSCDPPCKEGICVLWGGKQSRCIARCDEQARICPDDRLRCLPLTLPPENIVGYFCLE